MNDGNVRGREAAREVQPCALSPCNRIPRCEIPERINSGRKCQALYDPYVLPLPLARLRPISREAGIILPVCRCRFSPSPTQGASTSLTSEFLTTEAYAGWWVGDLELCKASSLTRVLSFPGAPRMLYETAERFNLEHNKAFVNINHSHPPYHHPVRFSTLKQRACLGQTPATFASRFVLCLSLPLCLYDESAADDYAGG